MLALELARLAGEPDPRPRYPLPYALDQGALEEVLGFGVGLLRRARPQEQINAVSTLIAVASPSGQVLSKSQLALLAEHGEERTAAVGEKLFGVGDQRYPFMAIIEGEAAIQDATGAEIVRHGPSGFLGEMNLLSGQTVFLNAVVTQPMRYIAVDRDVLRPLLFEDGPLGDLLLSTFISRRELLQSRQGVGIEIIGPASSAATRRLVDWAKRNRLPHTWRDPEHSDDSEAADLVAAVEPERLPLVRLPGGEDLHNPSNGEVSRALGIGLALQPTEEVDLVVIGGGPAGLAAAVYGSSEGLNTLVVESTALGGQAGASRRIENYLGFPGGISGNELTSRAVTQARKFNTRTATPYRALALEPGDGRHVVRLEEDHEVSARAVVLASGAEYRRLPVAGPGGVRRAQRLLRRRPARGPALRRHAGRGRGRRQLGRAGRRLAGARRGAGDAAAPAPRPARDHVPLPGGRAGAPWRRGAGKQRGG